MSALKNPSTETVSTLQKALSDKDLIIAKMALRIATLEEYVMLDKIKKFGASSEKSPDQGEMFNEAELTVVADGILAELEQTLSTAAPQKKPGRKPLPADLPRIRIEHDLPESEQRCVCGCERTVIGEESSEQLDIIPAKIQVLVHVRKIYACKACEGEITTAPLPVQPIPKSNASPGLLAHIATIPCWIYWKTSCWRIQ